MEDLTIAKYLVGQLPRLKHKEDVIRDWEEVHPYKPVIPLVDRATYVGVELEIERVPNFTLTSPYWTKKKDGSLRNNGLEFVTPPLKVSRLEQALTELFNNMPTGYEYTERTSTHIHMNVRTLTLKQVETLVLIYMVFEKVLFNWVGHNRASNIFCVPLYDITLSDDFCKSFENLKNLRWEKYTALNLLPIFNQGTIEFRHLEGTNDIKRIMTWVNMLLCFKQYVLKTPTEYIHNQLANLNTTSTYWEFGEQVFGPELWNTLQYPLINKDISYCISNIKAHCLLKTKVIYPSNQYLAVLNKLHNIVEPPKLRGNPELTIQTTGNETIHTFAQQFALNPNF